MDELLPPIPTTLLPGIPGGAPEAVIAAFLGNVNGKTREAYGKDVATFTAWAGGTPGQALTRLVGEGPLAGHTLATAYREHLIQSSLSPATINRRISTLRMLVRYAKILGVSTWELDIRSVPAERYRDTAGPGEEALRKLLSYMDAQCATTTGEAQIEALRDRAAIQLLFYLGLRREEVSSLDLGHVSLDPTAPHVWVLGKGRGNREKLTLPPSVVGGLRGWLATRPAGLGPQAPLFVNLYRASGGAPAGQARLLGHGIWKMLQRRGVEATGSPIRPHAIRHGVVTMLLDNGNPIREVQRFSRHKSLETLQKYDDNRSDIAGKLAVSLELRLDSPPDGD